MLQKIKVKAEHAHKVFGFNNKMAPLGERDDLHLLYADAKAGNVKHLLEMFEEEPTPEVLDTAREEAFNQQQENKRRNRRTRQNREQ